MSVITRGFTFTDGILDQMTNEALHTLIDGATVTAIALTEFATTSHLIQVSASTPGSDQGDGSLWYDSTLGLLRQKNQNTRWDCAYLGPELSSSSGTIPKGAWVVASGDHTITVCATGRWPEVLGVAMTTAVSGGKTLVAAKGLQSALVIGPFSPGDVLVAAGHAFSAFGDGYAVGIKQTASGSTAATLGIPVGQVLGSAATGVTALRSVIIWR